MKFVFAAIAAAMAQHAVAAAPLSPVESAAGELQDFTHERLAAAVAPIAERALQEQGIVGLSVAIAHKGKPVYVAGFGMADLDRQRPATGDTQYEIASISKMFTAVAVLRLVEQGLLNLNSPVSTYLPNYEGPLRNAPIRTLLNHTNGFRDGPFFDETSKLPTAQLPRTATPNEKMTSSPLAKGDVATTPGGHFRYSSASFIVVGLIIEAVTGKSFGEVMREQIFDPLKMQRSTTGELNHPEATVYYVNRKDRAPAPAPNFNMSIYDGSGSIMSTPLELLAFQTALDEGRLLTPVSIQLLREPTIVTIGGESVKVPYGLGTRHGPSGGRRKLGHTGTWSGSAVLAHYPDDEVTIVVLANTNTLTQIFGADPLVRDAVHASDLESWIANAVFGDESPVYSAKPIPFDEEFARALTGRYQIGDFLYEHRWEEGELRVFRAATGEMRGRLLRVGLRATVYVAGDGELPVALFGGSMSNPPYEIDEWDANGNWGFTYAPGGMFSSLVRRVDPSD